ncbi:MAG: dihydroneopterin aldolase [Bacilli bacterium]
MDKMILKEMPFYGYHGVFPEETKLGQRFVIDVTLGLDLTSACQTDELHTSVNYGEVYETIRDIVEGEPVKLLEKLAQRIVDAIFHHYPLVQTVNVTVKKPEAPIPGILAYAAIQIERERT